MPTGIAKFTDVRTHGLGLQVQRLGNFPFRPTFPPQTDERRIALGFGRAAITQCIFGWGKRPDVPIRNP